MKGNLNDILNEKYNENYTAGEKNPNIISTPSYRKQRSQLFSPVVRSYGKHRIA